MATREGGGDGDEIQVNCPAAIYWFDQKTGEPVSSFWMKKTQAFVYDALPKDMQEAIPSPVNEYDNAVVALVYPWKELSVGTRFNRVPYWDTHHAYAVLVPHYESSMVQIDFVPRRDALSNEYRTHQEARACFVWLMNMLVDRVAELGDDRVIPYVRGGSSFVHAHVQSDFYRDAGAWYRDKAGGSCYTGYDCSELVMRMAQIVGINFPWKMSHVMEKMLARLVPGDELQDGDIIWIPGHVMIVSDREKNEVIESRGYGVGYGCVHRIMLSELLDGIESYDDLLTRFYNKETVWLKDSHGNVIPKEHPFALLKLINDVV